METENKEVVEEVIEEEKHDENDPITKGELAAYKEAYEALKADNEGLKKSIEELQKTITKYSLTASVNDTTLSVQTESVSDALASYYSR